MNRHPTGISTVAVSAVLLIAKRIGVELSTEEALVIVGLVAGVVSKFTPRLPKDTR